MLYIGIDLGTSAVKLLLMDEKGSILHQVSRDYPVEYPHPGWSQQNPEDWWLRVQEGITVLLKDQEAHKVKGIGVAGQMHGLVALDHAGQVIRPAILWNDSRTQPQTDFLNQDPGKEALSRLTGNIAFAGFTAPKLLWMRQEEPNLFARIAKILLPKDYINYRLTGVLSTDYSDASGTLLLDVEKGCWSQPMLDLCGITQDQLPPLHKSLEPIGTVKPDLARRLGLPRGVTVCAGAGDNAAAAVGCGVVGPGKCNISLGTSGTVFITGEQFAVDENNALHSFRHADGGYHLMGCILSAASCNQWWMENILHTKDYSEEQQFISKETLGCNPVYFLPYLMGERSPHNDALVRGAFFGLSMDTPREAMTQAVLEGVAFAIRDCVEIAKGQGIPVTSSRLCGGGAKSPLWQTILANVLGIPLELPQTEQGPGYGGAILAAVACGEAEDLTSYANRLCKVKAKILPEPGLVRRYQQRYQAWKQLYPRLKGWCGE